jgi:single-stranded-DNA-specific exonuclease
MAPTQLINSDRKDEHADPERMADPGYTTGTAPLPERILSGRHLPPGKERECFLSPAWIEWSDPFLLPDMDLACQVIREAVTGNQPIIIHGDYDVDGLTATALLVRFLRRHGIACEPLIPDRLTDGYGLSNASVEHILASGARLLITVDCGVTSVEAVARLMAQGVMVVVTDHHECPPVLRRQMPWSIRNAAMRLDRRRSCPVSVLLLN